MKDLKVLREKMVKEQLIARGIKDKSVLAAFRQIPREEFIPSEFKADAYGDYPVPIGSNQTISQPYIVALMTQELSLKKEDKVLEVGTGSGYQAAILAKICREVFGVERFPHLVKRAERVLNNLDITNVKIKSGDGTLGWEEFAPYDGIIVTASAPEIPQPLIEQLKEGGRLVIPVGNLNSQSLLRINKIENKIRKEFICDCVFVPLVGKYGWTRE